MGAGPNAMPKPRRSFRPSPIRLWQDPNKMKITIIGGGGRVGSCAAYALQCGGLVAEIQILDANKDMAEGEALDLLHGSAFAGDQRIYSGDYARAADSDLFLITAGLR